MVRYYARLEDDMGRIADVLSELTMLGAMGVEEPKAVAPPKPAPVEAAAPEAAPQGSEDEEPVEDYDPVALLTAGFKKPLEDDTEPLDEEDGTDDSAEEQEDDADESDVEDEESADDESEDVAVPDDEDSEDDAEDGDAEEEVDLAETVSRLLKEVEALAEQTNSVLWAMRELDALMKG